METSKGKVRKGSESCHIGFKKQVLPLRVYNGTLLCTNTLVEARVVQEQWYGGDVDLYEVHGRVVESFEEKYWISDEECIKVKAVLLRPKRIIKVGVVPI
ncbi:hypothetical protein DRO59_00860 [Candidatus Bathyarchaeota archaeon]|nr:MAG: hypothetical protein DRO59_00860 [Candidatus Bathyarchaeota archaeon]